MLMLAHLMIKTNKKIYEISSNIELPLGSSIPTIEDFCKEPVKGKIQVYFQNELVNTLNQTGNYQVKINIDNQDYLTTLTVIDKEAPNLILKEETILKNSPYTIHNFIVSCTDNSGEDCIVEFQESSMESYIEPGIYQITVRAKDAFNNETLANTKLIIIEPNIPSIEKKKDNTFSNDIVQDSSQTNESIKSKAYENITINATKISLYEDVQSQMKKEYERINQVLEYVNQCRRELGLTPLILSDKLSIAATIRSLEMAESEIFSHTRPNGTECFSIYSELKIMARFMGENIAYGYHTPLGVSEEWKKSPSHYANMINPNYLYIGIGITETNGEYYWTQLFSDTE